MSRACPLCEHPEVDRWELCRRIERSRGPEADVPSFLEVKRELAADYDIETTLTTLKVHVADHLDVPAVGARFVRERLFGDSYDTVLEEVPEVSAFDLSETLPARPLTDAEVRVLASHPDVDGLHAARFGDGHESVPAEIEGAVLTVWLEVDGLLVTLALGVKAPKPEEKYDPPMDLDHPLSWALTEVERIDELATDDMLRREDYLHVTEWQSTLSDWRTDPREGSAEGMNTEGLDAMMQDGYDHREAGELRRAGRLWLELWEFLQPRFTPEMTHVYHADQEVFSGLQSIQNWCQDVKGVLGEAGKQDPRFHELRIQYCREFCEQFPETDLLLLGNMRAAIAKSLVRLGRVEEGEAEFEALTEELPEYGWGYIKWGDIYRESSDSRPDAVPPDDDRAAKLYRAALSRDIDPHTAEVARNRLAEFEAPDEQTA